jgi:Fe-S-cluster containining protein
VGDLELRFQCQSGCTKCCEQPGFVYLTEEDHLRIATYVGMTPDEFSRKYLYRTKRLRRLRVPKQVRCPFLESSGCRIHDVKPLQCRTFPYWPGLMDNRREWGQTGKWCPGIGKGELVNIQAARSQFEEMRDAHPHLYS